jgi:hypothetical protein
VTLADIIAADGSSSWAAERCLELLVGLPVEDLAFPAIAVATQTYGLLAIAEAIAADGASVSQAISDAAWLRP